MGVGSVRAVLGAFLWLRVCPWRARQRVQVWGGEGGAHAGVQERERARAGRQSGCRDSRVPAGPTARAPHADGHPGARLDLLLLQAVVNGGVQLELLGALDRAQPDKHLADHLAVAARLGARGRSTGRGGAEGEERDSQADPPAHWLTFHDLRSRFLLPHGSQLAPAARQPLPANPQRTSASACALERPIPHPAPHPRLNRPPSAHLCLRVLWRELRHLPLVHLLVLLDAQA